MLTIIDFHGLVVVVPRIIVGNYCGQLLRITENNDIYIHYSYSKDERKEKETYPEYLKVDDIVIAIWDHQKIGEHINKKFNINGFFICKKIGNTYQKICFGKTFNFECFIENIKTKLIIFDSGMYEGNSRNYSMFRSSNTKFWNKLITEEF